MLKQAFAFFASVMNDLPDTVFVAGLRARVAAEGAAGAEESAFADTAAWLAPLSDEEACTALGVDRARLMRHVDASCIVPPYESLYTASGENDTIGALNAFFIEAGMGRVGTYREAADYLGLEFSFLEECCRLEEEAATEGREADAVRYAGLRERFIAEHVGTWAGRYAENMAAAAKTGFYRDFAKMVLDTFPAE